MNSSSRLSIPLFPPSKLSQSATPLYLQSDVVFLPSVHFSPFFNLLNSKEKKKKNEVTDFDSGVANFRMIMHDMYVLAFVGLAISGATDWLDGYVARRMGINSVVGSYLVPLADKLDLLGS